MKEDQASRRLDYDICLEFFRIVNDVLARPVMDGPDFISQNRLRRYKMLERYNELISEAFEKERNQLLNAIELRSEQEEGDLIGVVEPTERRSPSWKEIVIELRGKAYAEERLAQAKVVRSLKLRVLFRAKLLESGGVLGPKTESSS